MSEARSIRQEVQTPGDSPDLVLVSTPEEFETPEEVEDPERAALLEKYFLADEFEIILGEHADFKKPNSGDTEKAVLRPMIALTFVQHKIERVPGRKVFVPPQVVHSSPEKFSLKYLSLGTSLGPDRPDEAAYLKQYGEYAEKFASYPEIFVTLKLRDHAIKLGKPEIAYAADVLLAAYGRAHEIILNAGSGGVSHNA